MSSLPTTAKATTRSKPFSSTPPQAHARNPVIIDIVKNSAYLGKDNDLISQQKNYITIIIYYRHVIGEQGRSKNTGTRYQRRRCYSQRWIYQGIIITTIIINTILLLLLNLKFPLQPGFEVVEVDGKRLRGKSQSEATHLVAEAFNSTNQTMTLIVIPTK